MRRTSIDTLVIGAGPYGLSVSAHLMKAGVDHVVLGHAMEFWSERMPKGMCLKSPPRASSLYDPDGNLTLEAFYAERGQPVEAPVPLEAFVAYGHWFRERARVGVDPRLVRSLRLTSAGFVAALEDQESILAKRVVVAAGIEPFRWIPLQFRALPRELVSHTGQHNDMSIFAGKELMVLGAGQSAVECAVLARRHGANVRLILRDRQVRWLNRSARLHDSRLLGPLLYARSDVGPAGLSRVVDLPAMFALFPSGVRDKATRRCARPAAAGWQEEAVSSIPVHTGFQVRHVNAVSNRLQVEGTDGTTLQGDHLLLGTGYEVNLSQYSFLERELVSAVRCVEGFPVLKRGMESSVPGLHFVGWPAIRTYGPLMRHVSGAKFSAKSVSAALAPGHARVISRVRATTTGQFHFDAEAYLDTASAKIPNYRGLQAAVADATRGIEVGAILDLGVGTGETAAAVLEAHPKARITGLDASSEMLAIARKRLPPENVSELMVGKLQGALPPGPFDAIVTSLAVHHLTARQKRKLFARVHGLLKPEGRFVLADVTRAARPEEQVTPTSRIHDRLESAANLHDWLIAAGFNVSRAWSAHDLVVLLGEKAHDELRVSDSRSAVYAP